MHWDSDQRERRRFFVRGLGTLSGSLSPRHPVTLLTNRMVGNWNPRCRAGSRLTDTLSRHHDDVTAYGRHTKNYELGERTARSEALPKLSAH